MDALGTPENPLKYRSEPRSDFRHGLLGVWNIPGNSSMVSGMSPARSASTSLTYSFNFADGNGLADLSKLNLLINGNYLDGRSACYLAYVPSSWSPVNGSIYLVNDAGAAGGPYSGTMAVTNGIGSGLAPANSQCSVNGATVSVTGTNVTLGLNLAFRSPAFAGDRVFWAAAFSNSQGSSDWQSVGTVSAPQPGQTVPITVSSSPFGRVVLVDGVGCATPCAYGWVAGSSHTISASGPQAGTNGTQYVFGNWSDGGAGAHTIVVPAAATTYGANFTTQYLLTTKSIPSSGGTVTPTGSTWYNANQTVGLAETPATGFRFTSFNNSGGALSGNTVSLTGPTTVTGSFNIATGMTAALISCAAGAYNTCTLDPGNYIIDNNLPISVATNVTITGGGAGRADTRLIRGPNHTLPLMQIGDNGYAHSSTPLSGITIQNLTFCGGFASSTANPTGNPPHLGCSNPPSSTSALCATNCDGDLIISNTSPSTWTPPIQLPPAGTPPFTSSGSYHVTITNTAFADSIRGHPIFITPFTSSQSVNDVHITNSVFSGGNVQHGSYAFPFWLGDHTQCDNWSPGAFSDAAGPGLPPFNIVFDENTWYSGRGGISGIARYLTINHNTFTGYYWPGDDVGGTIEQEGCADKVNITNNTIDGNWTAGSVPQGGMELYGRNIYIDNNVVKNEAWGGISILSTYRATVTRNHLWNNGQAGDQFPHIGVATSFPGDGTCSPGVSSCDAVRDTDGPIVQNNDSKDPASGIVQASPTTAKGVWLDGGNEGSTSNMVNLVANAIQGNSMSLATNGSQVVASQRLAINSVPVSLGGVANSALAPVIGSVALDVTDIGVHTIAVFPEGQAPLGPKLCRNDAVARRCFQFGANDPVGAANLMSPSSSLEGFLEALPSASQAVGGPAFPTSNSCHFIYFPYTSSIYLDSPAGMSNFVDSAPLDGGSTKVLTNGVCSIYAFDSRQSSGPNNVTLVVDMNLSSGTWYLYEFLTNSQGQHQASNQAQGLQWSLWGYWRVP